MSVNSRPDLDTAEIVRRYQSGESSKSIAADLECSVRTIFLRLKKVGVEPRPQGKVKPFGPDHPQWQGGRYYVPSGYVYLSINGRKVAEHRYVMEQQLGRLLAEDEDVHHINRVRDDNRPENLIVVTKEEHARLHDDPQHRRPGQRNGAAVLTDDQAAEIRHRRASDRVKILDLAREYGVGKTTIKRILSGMTYRNIVAEFDATSETSQEPRP